MPRNTIITLQANIPNLLARVVMIGLTIFIEYLWIDYALKDPHNTHIIFWKLRVTHLFYFLIALFILFVITVAFSLSGIIKVQVDKDNNIITFTTLFCKFKISTNDIETYDEVIHRNNVKTFYGILLNLKSNKQVQLAEQNLKSVPKLKEYLVEKNIPCGGQRRMKFPFN